MLRTMVSVISMKPIRFDVSFSNFSSSVIHVPLSFSYVLTRRNPLGLLRMGLGSEATAASANGVCRRTAPRTASFETPTMMGMCYRYFLKSLALALLEEDRDE